MFPAVFLIEEYFGNNTSTIGRKRHAVEMNKRGREYKFQDIIFLCKIFLCIKYEKLMWIIRQLTLCTKHKATNSVVEMQFSKSFKNVSLWKVYNSCKLPNNMSALPCRPAGTIEAIFSDNNSSR